MSHVAPLAPSISRDASGNPLAVAAGLATLAELRKPDVYRRLDALGGELERGTAKRRRSGPRPADREPRRLHADGLLLRGPVTDYASAKRADTKRYARYFHEMLARGVFQAPSQFEAAFVSLAHTDADIALAGRAAAQALTVG